MRTLIDMHCHFLNAPYLEMLKRHGAELEDGFPLPVFSMTGLQTLRERCAITYSLLSVSSPQPYFDDTQESQEICRSLNEDMAALQKSNHAGIGFMAVLPLPDVAAALTETRYALDTLKARGVKLASNSRGLYLGDPRLDPLMEELNARQSLVCVHPHRPAALTEALFPSGPVPLYEFLADTTRALLNLIGHDVILRYPRIRWIVPHCGSFLPNILDRVTALAPVLQNRCLMGKVAVQESVSRLCFDLSGTPAPHLLKWLLTITTPENLIYGSDFPFTPLSTIESNLKGLEKLLESPELQEHAEKICSGNAGKLLRPAP